MEQILQGLGYGFRGLVRRPGMTAVAMLILSIGIGSTTAVFSVVNGILIEPLPFPDPNRLVRIFEENLEKDRRRSGVSPTNFQSWSLENQSFEQISILSQDSLVLTESGAPERILVGLVSPSFFSMLGVEMIHGRSFRSEDGRRGGEKVAVADFEFWKTRLGGDKDRLGRTLAFGDRRIRIVGVLPAGFRFGDQPSLWQPKTFDPSETTEAMRGARYLQVLGRLKEGVAIDRAESELDSLTHRLSGNSGWSVSVQPLLEQIVGDHRRSLTLLFAAVGFVLLIACMNVANLLLSRGLNRTREIAVRSALGATRFRLIRQMLVESSILFLLSGFLGVVLAMWSVNPLLALAPSELPRIDNVMIDGTFVGFALVLSLTTGLLFGLIPAFRLSRNDLRKPLHAIGHSIPSRPGRNFSMSSLIVLQIALSVVLLVGSGLIIQSFFTLRGVDTGFDAGESLTFSLALPETRYPEDALRADFVDRLLDGTRSIPGLEAIGASTNVPLTGSRMSFGYRVPDEEGTSGSQRFAQYHASTPGYFRAIGIPLLSGRDFRPIDRRGSAPVVIVNEALARLHWPEDEPVGKRIAVASRGGSQEREVIGVVSNVRHVTLRSEPAPELYVPYAQDSWPFLTVVLRSDREPSTLIPLLRDRLSHLDEGLPLDRVRTTESFVMEQVSSLRFQALLLSLFAGTALVLAAAGIYGVFSFLVAQSTRTVVIRLALGAQRTSVARSFVVKGLMLAGVGVAVGVASSLGLNRLIASLLFEVSPTDPITYALVAAVFAAVVIAACYLPARRAARLDPAQVLRSE